MAPIALSIVIAAAFLHACWNLLAKKSRNKIAFIWCFLTISIIFYIPLIFLFWPENSISLNGWLCVATTGVLHALYFWLLGGAYERADLSVVYPLSRGSGPLFVPLLAFVFIQERISLIGGVGIMLVVSGIYIIHLESFHFHAFLKPLGALKSSGSLWALGTGGTIAAYSIVDKVGVGLVPPPVYIYLMLLITWALLSPYLFVSGRINLLVEWKLNTWTILLVGILVLGTYLMILFSFRIAKVSYVVAVREFSIVFSVLLGYFYLGEKHLFQKISGSLAITAGVVCIALS
jgi:drug/metabolite transporter (DMT)-like permease